MRFLQPLYSSKNFRVYVCLLLITAVVIALYAWTYTSHELPYAQQGHDSYSHLGMVRSLRNEISPSRYPLVEDFYPQLYQGDSHMGPYFTLAAALSFLPRISPRASLFILAIMNICLVIWGAYYFFHRYSGNRYLALVGVAMLMLATSVEYLIKPQSVAAADMMVTAHYPSVFATGLMLVLLGLNLSFLEKPRTVSWLAQCLLVFVLFTSHPLTGFMYAVTLVLLLLFHRGVSGYDYRVRLALFALLPAAVLLALLWPFYNWLDLLFESVSPDSGGLSATHHDLGELFRVVWLLPIGMVFLFAKRRLFPLLWCIVFLFLSLSYLLPLNIPLYWRFIYVARIPMILGLAWGLIYYFPRVLKEMWRLAIVIGILVALVFVPLLYFSVQKVSVQMDEQSPIDRLSFLEDYQGSLITLLSLPEDMYVAQGAFEYDVPAVYEGHANQKIIGERTEAVRYAYATMDPAAWDELLEEYAPDYLIAWDEETSDLLMLYSNGRLVAYKWGLYLIRTDLAAK